MQLLRVLAKTMLRAYPGLSIGLEHPEDGLMYLTVSDQGTVVAEVYCVKGPWDSFRYGVFCFKDQLEAESYCQTESEVVALFEPIIATPVT